MKSDVKYFEVKPISFHQDGFYYMMIYFKDGYNNYVKDLSRCKELIEFFEGNCSIYGCAVNDHIKYRAFRAEFKTLLQATYFRDLILDGEDKSNI